VRPPHSWNVYTGRNSFEEWAKLVDCGDAPLTVMDNTVALKQLVKAHKVQYLCSGFSAQCLDGHC
jgi:agmatinase